MRRRDAIAGIALSLLTVTVPRAALAQAAPEHLRVIGSFTEDMTNV